MGDSPVGDFGSHAFHFGQACEIGKIYGVGDTGSASTEPRQSRFGARLTPRDQDDTGAHLGECLSSDFANSWGATRDDNGLALHERSRLHYATH
jgi:hypothetical protein